MIIGGTMKISPMDIQRQSFGTRFRGLDQEEVRTYLNLVAEEVVTLQRDRDRFEHEVQHLQTLIDEHRERETILKNTLLTAQRMAEDIKENARKQAESIVKEAELQSDRLLELAQRRAHDVERGILDLRGHRTTLRTDIRSFITRLTHILDLQEEAEVEHNLRFLKRREEGVQ
jgi:cell division initiation protein